VECMWQQRPPLLPNQFADRMGVRKQALSTWLNSDAVPAPPVVVRLARGMGRPVRELMTAAGYAPADDPLLDAADAWAYVRGEVEQMETSEWAELASAAALPEARKALLPLLQRLLQRLQERDEASAKGRTQTVASPSVEGADGDDAPSPAAERDEQGI
jgi:transcriptional regulator with XRE-family HTH domain